MNYDMEKVLPHKKPMVLIDDVIDFNVETNWVKTVVNINENCMFFDKELNGVSSMIGLEYMAQTIGAYSYFKNNMQPPKIGFLLGTRLFNTNIKTFENGKQYFMSAKEIFTDNRIVSFECFIYNEENEVCANANINVYIPEEDEAMGALNG